MNPKRGDEYDYLNLLVAAQKSCSCLEAGRVQPHKPGGAPAYDSLNRLLTRTQPNTEDLWSEAQPQVSRKEGLFLLEDSTLDKPYAKHIDLVYRPWSGKHHNTVRGINLLTLLWTEGDKHIPGDYRLDDKPNDNLSKNDPVANLLQVAYQRGFKPTYVGFDSWYSCLSNLKPIRQFGWHWLTRLKSNRLVNPAHSGNIPITRVDIGTPGRIVHLQTYGLVKVFKTVSRNGDVEYWATSDLDLRPLERLSVAEPTGAIENYHRGIKQFCGMERGQARSATAQRNHLGLSIRACLWLEVFSYFTGYSWFEAKRQIIRDAIRAYLQNPKYILGTTA